MARIQTFLARLCCLTLAVIFAIALVMGKAADWPSAIIGIVASGVCLLIFIIDVFGARLRKRFPFVYRFCVKPVRIVITDERTEVFYANDKTVFSLANQIVWRPEVKGGQVLAVGAPGEWLRSAPKVLPADAIHTDLIEEALVATLPIDELREALLCYCAEISSQKVGFWRWHWHQIFSPLKVELQIRDHLKRQLVGEVVRKAKLLGPRELVEVNTAKN
jgi:hypothetical protein